jgi:hypothetical protein
MSTPEERITVPDITTEEKRRKALKDTLGDLRRFHRKILKAHGGRPLPNSVSDLDEIRDGR